MSKAHAHTRRKAVKASTILTHRGFFSCGMRSIASMIKPKCGYFLTFIYNVFSGGTKHRNVSGSKMYP